MPTFSDYPALQVQAPTFDLQGIQRRSLQNQLLQSKLQQAQNPQADPRLQFDKEKYADTQKQQKLAQLANILSPYMDPNISEVQKTNNWPRTLQNAQAAGLDTSKAPQTYDPEWITDTVARLGQYQTQQKRLGTLSPQAEEQKIRIAQSTRAPERSPELIRLQRAYKKATRAGDEIEAEQILGRIEKLTEKSGINLTVGPDGTVDFSTGSQKGKQQQERKETGILAIQSVAAGANLLRSLEESGDASISFTGATARLIDSFLAQVTASAGLVNVELPPVDRYEFTGALAEKSAVVKSKAISLAFAMAVARQGSRPTDQDIVYFLDIIGARAGSSRQFAAALRSSIDEGMERFAIRYREETGSEWNWDAALKRNKIQYDDVSEDGEPRIYENDAGERIYWNGENWVPAQ